MTTVAIERAVLRAGYHEDYMTRPGRIVATIELHRIGDQESYFSVTGAIYEGQRREPDSAGCIHEQILTVWPQLAPLVELHLSTADGVPMHAEANGWFWLNVEPKRTNERLFGYKAPDNWMWRWTSPRAEYDGNDDAFETDSLGSEWAIGYVASTLRISRDEARQIREWLMAVGPIRAKVDFHAWIEAQRSRWKQEADAGIALIRSLNTSKED